MRNLNYQQKEMIYDINGGHDEVIVVEVNAQGLALDPVTRRFKSEFPKSWDLYMRKCIENDIDLGGVIMYTEDGVHIAMLTNVYFRVGQNKDDKDVVKEMTLSSIRNMLKIVGKEKKFVSGYIGDAFTKDVWGSACGLIKREGLNWSVYTK